MIDLDLTVKERRAYDRALASSHLSRLRVWMLDQDEKRIGGLTAAASQVLDGAVQFAWPAPRQLHLRLVDRAGRLEIERDHPSRAAIWPDRFVAVKLGTFVADLDRWVDCPVFWGPITSGRREGPVVEIEALGKDVLGLAPHLLWKNITVEKSTEVTEAIRKLMRAKGERRFDFPELDKRLNKERSYGRQAEAMKSSRKLARSINRQLFYDGRGRLRLRRAPERVSFTFRGGEGGTLLTPPAVSYDFAEARNVVEVLGAKPEKAKERVRAVASAPRHHPLSKWAMARNDEPRPMVEVVENDAIKRRERAEEVAERTLDNRLRASISVELEALVRPDLEELDVVACSYDGERYEFPMRSWTLPLPVAPMAVGFNRRVGFNRNRRGRQ